MSVVNDVLKDLNQRHAKAEVVAAIPYMADEKKSSTLVLWALLFLILSISIVLAVKMWNDTGKKYLSLNLPAELFLIDTHILEGRSDEEKIAGQIINTSIAAQAVIGHKELEANAEIYKITEDDIKSEQVDEKNIAANNIVANNIVENKVVKTQQTKAVEKLMAAIESDNHEQITLNKNNLPQALAAEVTLRLMIKESPQDVLPYIKNNYIKFEQKADLLAMSAQAQQRAGLHISAIGLYKKLIVMQPEDARWRAGLAISLESIGKKEVAAKSYQLALSMDNLPTALQRFSQSRLVNL